MGPVLWCVHYAEASGKIAGPYAHRDSIHWMR